MRAEVAGRDHRAALGRLHDARDLVARLIKAGADVNTVNDYGSTPLTEAATAGDTAVIKRLLEAGADARRPARTAQPR
jgi:ankyrin repeat protein